MGGWASAGEDEGEEDRSADQAAQAWRRLREDSGLGDEEADSLYEAGIWGPPWL